MLKAILCFIPLIYIFFLLWLKKIKLYNKINILFYSILSIILSLFLSHFTSPKEYLLTGSLILSMINGIAIAGFPEEFAKYFSIKCINYKDKDGIIISSILISSIVIVIEDIGYTIDSTFLHVFKRVITPLHLLFQIIMCYFLIKANKSTDRFNKIFFNVLAIVVPVFIHGIYDGILFYTKSNVIGYILGIFTYFLVTYIIIKKVSSNITIGIKQKIKYKIIKIPVIIFTAIFILFLFMKDPFDKGYSMNQKVEIRDNITLEVKDAKKVIIKDINEDVSVIKVKMILTNNSDLNLNHLNTKIYLQSVKSGERVESELFVLYPFEDDIFDFSVKAHDISTGYVYFETEKDIDYYKLKYCFTDVGLSDSCKLFNISKKGKQG